MPSNRLNGTSPVLQLQFRFITTFMHAFHTFELKPVRWHEFENGTWWQETSMMPQHILPIHFPFPRSVWELRTQKSKPHLLWTQSSKVITLKPGVGQYIAKHATLTARDFFLPSFCHPGPFTCIFSQNLSRVFPRLAVANTGSCVGSQNKLGHPARCYRLLIQVPVLGTHGK